MPIRIEYDGQKSLLTATVSGEFTFDETQEAMKELMDHPALEDPETRILWDMSEAALVGLGPQEVQKLVGAGASGLAKVLRHRRAVVVKHDLHFGIAREYDAYRTPSEQSVNLFRSKAEALRFLGVDDD